MAEFTYNNTENISTDHMLFEFNCSYQPRILYKDDLNLYSKFKAANEQVGKLKNLMTSYYKNFYHTQKLQKQAHDKNVKLKNYALINKF